MWHAGDIGCIDVIKRLSAIVPVVRAVSGNIDHGMVRRACPNLLEFEVEGVRVLLTHIGGYPGRYAPGMRTKLLASRPALMVCGHSHILKVIYDQQLSLLHLNPGAAGHHGWQQKRTLLRIELHSGTPRNLEIIELGR